MRVLGVIYGAVSYALFLAVYTYFIGFLLGLAVPKDINSGAVQPGGFALLVNLGLLVLFGLQHSLMSRPAFKQWLTRTLPAALERSTYVLASSIALAVLMALWQPMPAVIWHLEGIAAIALWAVAGLGWALVLASSFAINHFHMFGLQQIVQYMRRVALTAPAYQENWLYLLVRHPLMLGFLLAFWAAPMMTVGHLVFAAGMTIYILIALPFEERDLKAEHGEAYRRYTDRVPMLIPFTKRKKPHTDDRPDKR